MCATLTLEGRQSGHPEVSSRNAKNLLKSWFWLHLKPVNEFL